MKLLYQLFVSLTIILINIQSLYAIDYNDLSFYNFKNDNSSHRYIAYNTVQDSDGYVWTGSQIGLTCYNGDRLKTYSFDTTTNRDISYIYGLTLMGEDEIILSSATGIYLFDKSTEIITKYPNIEDRRIYRAVRYDSNRIWLTTNKDILLYNIRDYTMEVFTPMSHLPISSGRSSSYRMYGYHTKQGEFIVTTYNYCLIWNDKEWRFDYIKIPLRDDTIPTHISTLAQHNKDSNLLYLGTDQGLILYNREQDSYKHIIDADRVDALKYDVDGKLWVGTSNGLYCLNSDDNIISINRADYKDTNTISHNLIHNIYFDRDHNMWVGTEQGLCVTSFNKSTSSREVASLDDNFKGFGISRIDKHGDYIILYGSDGLILYNEKNGDVKKLSQSSKANHKMLASRVTYTMTDKEEDLIWIATSKGLHSYDFKNDRIISYNIICNDSAFNSGWIYNIREHSGLLYLTTFESGIFVVKKDDLLKGDHDSVIKAKKHYSHKNKINRITINSDLPYICKIDSTYITLMHHYNTIELLDKVDQERSRVVFKSVIFNGGSIIGISEYKDNKLFLIEKNQLSILDIDSDQQQYLSILNMPEGVYRYCKGKDKYSYWFLTSSLLVEVNIEEGIIVNRIELDYSNTNINDILFDKGSNSIYFTKAHSFGKIDISTIRNQVVKERSLKFTALEVSGQNIEVGVSYNDNIILQKSISRTDELELQYDQNHFVLDFATIPSTPQKGISYSYRLKGFSDSWVKRGGTPSGNSALFINIPPGKYILEVKTTNQTNHKPIHSSISITIRPPWYLSTYAIICYIIMCITAMLYIVYKIRMRHIRKMEAITREKSLHYSNLKIEFMSTIFGKVEGSFNIIAERNGEDPLIKQQTDILRSFASKFKGVVNSNDVELDSTTIDENDVNNDTAEVPEDNNKNQAVNSIDKSLMVKSIDKIIIDNISDTSLNITFLSEHLNISTKRLYALLKEQKQATPADYIRDQRLIQASILLMQGGFTVSEVLYMVGFSSHSYFTKCFKIKYGITPKEYSKPYKV